MCLGLLGRSGRLQEPSLNNLTRGQTHRSLREPIGRECERVTQPPPGVFNLASLRKEEVLHEHRVVRRNRVSDVTFSSARVLVFEGKDYQSNAQAMWYEPAARPHVGMVDGGGSRVTMAKVIAATSASAVTPEPGKIDAPSEMWNPGEHEMLRYQYGTPQGFIWTFNKPAYFWRTRNGIQGRDLP